MKRRTRRPKDILPPQVLAPDKHWHRLSELPPLFNRSLSTLSRWCTNGTFADFGYETYLARGSSRTGKVWFVAIPENEL